MRVLPIKSIPQKLYDSKVLHMPPELIYAYRRELESNGVLEKATDGAPKKSGIHGGAGIDETLEHFAYRFAASSGRVEYSTLSPCSSLDEVSDSLLSTFSYGEVSVLDIAGGTGAAISSLLSTIALLREHGVLARQPLTIKVLSADISNHANNLYENMLSKLQPSLTKNGIECVVQFRLCDATRNDHIASLIDDWFDLSSTNSEFIVFISNFSGALSEVGSYEAFEHSLSQIMGRLSGKKSTLIWLEPDSNKSTKLWKRLKNSLASALSWLTKRYSHSSHDSVKYTMKNPLNDNTFPGRVTVQRFVRK